MNVKIVKVGINGEGIGYIEKQPVFVAGALPEEEVEIAIKKRFPKYKIGELKRIIKPSKERQQPPCPLWECCQACSFMHVRYETQLFYKTQLLSESLRKYANIKADKLQEIVQNPAILHYRNALKLPFHMKGKRLVVGMYQKDSNQFVEVKSCCVHEKRLDEIKQKIVSIANTYKLYAYSNQQKDGLRYLVIRGIGGQYQCTLVSGKMAIPTACVQAILAIDGIKSVWQSFNSSKKSTQIFGDAMQLLGGNKNINFKFQSLTVSLSPRAFFQLNTIQAEHLYRLVGALLQGHKKLIVEAYCGVGVMSLALASKADKIIGIEQISDAVANAKRMAQRNQIKHAKFICGDAGKEMIKIAKREQIDVLIVDPPRSGLDDTMLETMMKANIKQVVYISCNPATLAKNLQILKQKYTIEKIIPLDMFSNTAHLETIVLMSKIKK